MRQSLSFFLAQDSTVPYELRHLLIDIAIASKYVSYAIQTTEHGLLNSENSSGETQIALDVISNTIFTKALQENASVAAYTSEEEDAEVAVHSTGTYSVAFDPLDGSSLVNANFSIGSIFGIYQSSTIIGQLPKNQVAALYVLYGPRTILVYTSSNGVHEFLLNDVGEFVLLRKDITIEPIATHYSPGNLRSITSNAAYAAVHQDWLNTELTLRYSGCMVADIHHILAKSQGVFVNVGGEKYPQGKLRLAFECGPFAFLIENAKGLSSDGNQSILDIEITDIHQRTPIIVGSQQTVVQIQLKFQ